MTTHRHQKRRFTALLTIIALLSMGLAVFCVISSGEDKIKIYFYSSETNINNFKSLKMEFDRYLSRFGPYEFQPFSARDVFEKQVKGKENCLLLLSSWHYRHIHREYSLMPALTGVRNGKKYQRKVLVAHDKAPDIESAKPGLIASASSLQYTISVLKRMLKKYAGHPFRVLTVPKDIDALMSVGFGMAKLGFASKNAFDELRGVNPRLCRKMKVVAEGEETLLMIVALPQGCTADREKMVGIIKNMPNDSDGRKRIRMLGLDAWQELNASDRSKLES
ncbi:MAG: hypothetical protein JRH00_08160 [Deltaproteobacteria bacterium]|nr:hypothetical protein [Deltaproteobacteria bacterium]